MDKKKVRRVKVTYLESTEEQKKEMNKLMKFLSLLLLFLYLGYTSNEATLFFVACCVLLLMIVFLVLEFVFGRKVMLVNVK